MSSDILNLPVRLVEHTSHFQYQLDEASNQWKAVSSDKPVTEKFNEWADANEMNPVGPPTVTTSLTFTSSSSYVIIDKLCVATVKMVDHARMELATREQMPRVASTIPQQSVQQPNAGGIETVDVQKLADVATVSNPPVPSNLMVPGTDTANS